MQIIGNATPQAAMEIQRQLTAGAGPFTLQGMQVAPPLAHARQYLSLPPMCAPPSASGACGGSVPSVNSPMQGSDPGSGSGRTDQDAMGKGDDNLALTDEDLQARRIKVTACNAPIPDAARLLPEHLSETIAASAHTAPCVKSVGACRPHRRRIAAINGSTGSGKR